MIFDLNLIRYILIVHNDELDYDETLSLQNTPKGVFQAGKYVVGPMGIISACCVDIFPLV